MKGLYGPETVLRALGCASAAVLMQIWAGPLALAQDSGAIGGRSSIPAGTLETVVVHGVSLEGSLEGDSADRDVLIYLPPSYGTDSDRRYPVVYNLHGYSLTGEAWANILGGSAAIDGAIAGGVQEMIVVMPDAMTIHGGAMYSTSVVTGDWLGFIAHDLVDYVDANYRTIADPDSRGLMGHSMGGYGTLRVAMKHPDVFSSIYAMSSCCLSARQVGPGDAALEEIDTIEEAQALDMGGRTTFAASAVWSPNPDNPPFYLDLPTENGEVRAAVVANWAGGAPNVLIHQAVPALRSLDAIGLEIGLQDFLLADNVEMDRLMTMYGIEHSYETYEGDHVNRIPERYVTDALPFFSGHLAGQ